MERRRDLYHDGIPEIARRTMTIDRVASWLTCVAAVSTAWSAGVHDAAAEQPIVSVVTDRVPGPAAAHGLEKLTAALSAKGVACEKAASLAEARGKILIVAGLAGGDGPAARLLQTENHPVPAGPGGAGDPANRMARQAGLGDRRLGRPRPDVRRTGRGGPHRLERPTAAIP